MSALVVCPDCKRKLKVPDTAVGKTIRCPACKALIPTVSAPLAATDDEESSKADRPAPRQAVKAEPPARTAPARAPSRPYRDEEAEDDNTLEEVEPIRKKSSGRKRPVRKNSSTGLIIGLAVGGVLLFMVLGGGLLFFAVRRVRSAAKAAVSAAPNAPVPDFVKAKTNVPEVQWQTFAPPGGACSLLMPGTPQTSSETALGITVHKFLAYQMEKKAFYAVAFASFGPDPVARDALTLVANAQRDHVTRTVNGKVTREAAITLGNLPGREFQMAFEPQGTLIQRFYLAKVGGKHQIYIVTAAGDTLVPNAGDAVRFFDSFQLDASATPPTFAAAGAKVKPLQLPHFVHQPLRNRPLPPIRRPTLPPRRVIPRR